MVLLLWVSLWNITNRWQRWIWVNEIGDDGAAALSEGLKYNKSLTTLNLSDNEICDDGATATLGECLKYNKSPTTLNLRENVIGDDGAAALVECLKYNKSLTTLYWVIIKLVMIVLLLWMSVWNIANRWQRWIWVIMKLVMIVPLLWVLRRSVILMWQYLQ